MAKKCGIDPDRLEATVAAFNRDVGEKGEDALGKARDKLRPIGEGPYYAVNVSLHNKFAPTFAFTLGGLSIADTVFSGRRAGRAAIGNGPGY